MKAVTDSANTSDPDPSVPTDGISRKVDGGSWFVRPSNPSIAWTVRATYARTVVPKMARTNCRKSANDDPS